MSIPGDDYERQQRGEIPGLTGTESHLELAKYHLETAQSVLEDACCVPEVADLLTAALDLLYASHTETH